MTDRAPRRLSPLTPLVRGFIVLVAAAWTVVRDVTSGEIGPTASLFGLLLLVGVGYGAASWLRTTFWIEADELRIDTGVISRQSRRIRIDRLQGVDIVQPLVARLLGLAELRMDVAGGGAREGGLAYLPLGEARRLRDLLLTRRDELRAPAATPPSADGEPGTPEAPGVQLPAESPDGTGVAVAPPPTRAATPQQVSERPIARVDLRMLVLSTLLSSETMVLVAVLLGVAVVSTATGQWLGFSALLPLLLGLGVSLYRRFSSGYAFTVAETPAGMQVTRGLFDLSSQTITLPRVQGIVVSEPLLWRALGWARLDVSIAGYGRSDEGRESSTVLPVGERRVVEQLARHVLGGLDPSGIHLRDVPARARWAAPVFYRFLRVGTDEHLVVSREGWLTRRTHVAPQARVQSVRVTQGPWQRRLGLADVHLDSPPGPTNVRARHRDADEARRLYEVETAMTAWARRQ